ncbi:MAG: spherulation-specific family 4 protein [Hydrococcus sp. Prado102]|nr:spherulation-specific family 4 protein [Hydrococcus sp. Prado102]
MRSHYYKYYNLSGIFLDEAASGIDKLDYYQELYKYIKAKPNLDLVVLNQGTHVDENYIQSINQKLALSPTS